MRRIAACVVGILMGGAFAVAPVSELGADGLCLKTDASVFGGGNGSVSNPYLISTTTHLVALSDDANRNTWGCNFKQTANIDLASIPDWKPIGYQFMDQSFQTITRSFFGTYDGGGFSISNLTITAESAKRSSVPLFDTGLFGVVDRGLIKNLSLVNPTSNTSEIDVNNTYQPISGRNGFLVGQIRSSTIRNISITGGRMPVVLARSGAIAGGADASVIENIAITDVQFLKPYDQGGANGFDEITGIGALIGDDDGNFVVSDVTVSVAVIKLEHKNQACRSIGGLVGRANDATNFVRVSVQSEIDLSCDSITGVAGLSGENGAADRITVNNSDVDAKITIVATSSVERIAGVVGYAHNGSVFDDVRAKSSIEVTSNANTNRIAGFIGQGRLTVVRNVAIDTAVTIRASTTASGTARLVGGAIGEANDVTMSDMRVNSDISVTTLGTANEIPVREIAGVIGEAQGRGSLLSVLSNSNISITASGLVKQVGGVVGYRGDDGYTTQLLWTARAIDATSNITINSASTQSPQVQYVGGYLGNIEMPLSDAVISSTITTTGTGTHERIAGLVARQDASDTVRSQSLSRVVLRSTVPTVPQGANHTSLMIGTDMSGYNMSTENADGVRLAIADGVLFDSTISGVTTAGDGQPGTAATTAQLADIAYLQSQGFDTDAVWCVNAGRPALVSLTPACQSTLRASSDDTVIRARVGVPMRQRNVTVSGASGATTYSVSPALPRGITLNSQTGVLSGTPRKMLATTTFTVTASDSIRTSSVTFTLTVGKRPKFIVELADRARNVVFANNSATLSTTAKKNLRKIAKRLRNAERVVIQGHVSVNEASSAATATRLSRQRAVAVRRYLARLGVSVDVAVGYDTKRPSRMGSSSRRATVFWLNP